MAVNMIPRLIAILYKTKSKVQCAVTHRTNQRASFIGLTTVNRGLIGIGQLFSTMFSWNSKVPPEFARGSLSGG